MAKTPSQMSVEEIDAALDEQGKVIEEARKKMRPLLKAKDKLVVKETEDIRANGAQTLGDN